MRGKPIQKVPEQLKIHPAGVRGRGPRYLKGPVCRTRATEHSCRGELRPRPLRVHPTILAATFTSPRELAWAGGHQRSGRLFPWLCPCGSGCLTAMGIGALIAVDFGRPNARAGWTVLRAMRSAPTETPLAAPAAVTARRPTLTVYKVGNDPESAGPRSSEPPA